MHLKVIISPAQMIRTVLAIILLTLFVLLGSERSRAQQSLLSLDHDFNTYIQSRLSSKDISFHSALKPYLESEVRQVLPAEEDTASVRSSFFDSENFDLLSIGEGSFRLMVNPLLDIRAGYEFNKGEFIWETGVGAQLKVDLGTKFSIGGDFRYYRGEPLPHIREYIMQRGVVPGYRLLRDNGDVTSMAGSAWLSFAPNRHFSLVMGHGRQFWGDGYRSFFLSDNAANYPYFKMTASFWRIKYVYMINVMRYADYDKETRTFSEDFSTKMGAFHYLSIDAARWLQIGFFEGVVWKYKDSTGTRGVEFNYLNPMVFLRPVEFALGSPDNVILGLNFKFKLTDNAQVYSQLVLDDLDVSRAREGKGFYRTKIAWQMGARAFNLFGVDGFNVQNEFNMVRPYTFAHKTPEQNYAHLNESLVHNLGANFWELIWRLDYTRKWFRGRLAVQMARIGSDQGDDHNGSDIFISDFEIVGNVPNLLDFAYGNNFLQGDKTNLFSLRSNFDFLIHRGANFYLSLEYYERILKNQASKDKTYYVGISLTTGLFNRYTDF